MRQSLQGEHAVVTGGAAGIGLELAKACLRRGASVSVIDLARDTKAAAAELASAVPSVGAAPSFSFYRADVGNFAEVSAHLQAYTSLLQPKELSCKRAPSA